MGTRRSKLIQQNYMVCEDLWVLPEVGGVCGGEGLDSKAGPDPGGGGARPGRGRGQTREGRGPDPGGGGARPGRGRGQTREGRGQTREGAGPTRGGGQTRGGGGRRGGAGPDAGGGVEQGAESRAAFCLGKSWTLVLEMRGNTGKGHNGI